MGAYYMTLDNFEEKLTETEYKYPYFPSTWESGIL